MSPESPDQPDQRGPEASSEPGSEPAPASTPHTSPGMWEPPLPEDVCAMLQGYEVTAVLGRGGMGAVYKGIQTSLDRPVAIKLLPPEVGASAEFEERFKREAKAMAQLNHPHIVQIYNFGQTDAGHHYIVMEFVDGHDFHQLIHGDNLDAEAAVNSVMQICDALHFAHDKGFVHRDIKPANIYLNTAGELKIGDFGLAKLVGGDDDGANKASRMNLTMTGEAMGTPHYVAPEQLVEGAPIDGRADLYSLGVMFYEMLTGEIPRGAVKLPSAKVAGLDPRLDAVVFKAMESEPERRFASAAELQKELGIIRTTRAPAMLKRASAQSVKAAKKAAKKATKATKKAGTAAALPGKARKTPSRAAKSGKAGSDKVPPAVPVAAAASGGSGPVAQAVVVPEDGGRNKGLLWAAVGGGVLAVVAAGLLLTGGGDGGDGGSEGGGDEGGGNSGGGAEIAKVRDPDAAGSGDSGSVPEAATPVALAPASSQSAAAFAADSPYENSFGMRFVPVEITGGPTASAASGKTVLFSIWETRRKEYRAFIEATGRDWPNSEWKMKGFEQSAEHPAVHVSWKAAEAFCAWLTQRERAAGAIPEGAVYRLPSDHEWSCAAGIGEREDPEATPQQKDKKIKDYSWGESWPPPPMVANLYGEETAALPHGDLEPIAGYADGFTRTAPVGSFPPNELGLHDLTGNVHEWCGDWFDEGSDRRGARSSTWGTTQNHMVYLSMRYIPPPDFPGGAHVGFRCILELPSDAVIPAIGTTPVAAAVPDVSAGGKAGDLMGNALGMQFCWIPAGTFTMGEADRRVEVELSQGFWLGKFEVTQAEYLAVMGNNPSRCKESGERAPVEMVHWHDAVEFCAKLTERERAAGRLPDGWAYVLPSEAQWEYACRAGSKTRFAFGNDVTSLADYGWFKDNSGGTSHPAGEKKPNAWGLHDMHGNVWEWCVSESAGKVSEAGHRAVPEDATAPQVRRGGNLGVPAIVCRSTVRHEMPPGFRGDTGFRAALVFSGILPESPGKVEMASGSASGSLSESEPPSVSDLAPQLEPASPDDPVGERLTQLAGIFRETYAADVEKPHTDGLSRLDSQFSGALKRAEDAAAQKGELALVLLLQEEAGRIGRGQGVPEQDVGGLPPTVTRMRKTYLVERAKLETARDGRARPLIGKYLSALDSYQAELVRARDFDGALRVKAMREDVAARLQEAAASVIEEVVEAAVSVPTRGSVVPGRSAALATASREKPYNNSLRMLFVPVPVTGGPTDAATSGKTVLFSVWETRREDYEEFVDRTDREWKENPGDDWWQMEDFEQEDDHPAVMVSWEAATAFCEWLTDKERKAKRIGAQDRYRLPSDHEWSCAAGIGEQEDPAAGIKEKDGKVRTFFWGFEWPPPAGWGNCLGQEVLAAPLKDKNRKPLPGYSDGFVRTAPVGSFAANAQGLYDLGGNVWEWCEEPIEAASIHRVLRGGSWQSAEEHDFRPSRRAVGQTDNRNVIRGFRCVLELSGGG